MINEIVKATTDTMKEHEGISRVAGYIKNALQNDAAGYLASLRSEVEEIQDRIMDAGEAYPMTRSVGWCKIAKEHASSGADSAANLMGAKSPNAHNLIDASADAVRMTAEWSNGIAGDPALAIPESIFDHLQAVMDGLSEAIEAVKLRGEAIKDQGEMLAHRSSQAANSYLSET